MKRTLPFVLATVAATLTGIPRHAAADDTPPAYTLRDTHVGSRIPRDMVSSPVPFDKRYDELTPEQKAALRQDYESAGADDETPFPETGLQHLAKPLMKLAERDHLDGELVASADIGPDGQPRSVTVYKSPDPTMTELVRATLAQETYRPARCAGQPCAMAFMLRLEFLRP